MRKYKKVLVLLLALFLASSALSAAFPRSLILASAQSTQFREDFNTDVFSEGEWSRTDTSIYVDETNGFLHISADGGYDDHCVWNVGFELPLTIEWRARLVSGGNNYRSPTFRIEAGLLNPIGTVRLADTWYFGAADFPSSPGPSGENQWWSLMVAIEEDGGDLWIKGDSPTDSWTYLGASTWDTFGGPIVGDVTLSFWQAWDAVCDIDYCYVSSGVSVPHELEFYEVEQTVRLTEMAGDELGGHITQAIDGSLHMVYVKDGDVFIMHSQDGFQWTGPDIIEQGSQYDMWGVDICQTSDGTFWAAIRRNTGGALYEDIYLSNSTDGTNWLEPWALVETGTYDTYPRITVGPRDNLWVLYSHSITTNVFGDWDLYVLNSTDGVAWTEPQRVTNEPIEERWGDIYAAPDGSVHITYQRYDFSHFWIYETHSSDGVTWSEGSEVVSNTYIPQHGGSLTYHPRYGYVSVFATATQYDGDIHFIQSMDGVTWPAPELLIQSDITMASPDIVATSNRFYVSYLSNPTGTLDIYLAVITTVPPISGSVRDGEQHPISGVDIELYDSESSLFQTTSTDDTGAYVFYGLEEGDEYDVVMTAPLGAKPVGSSTRHAVSGDTVGFVLEWRKLDIQLTGEFDYLENEPIKVRISALVTETESNIAMVGVTVRITIYRPTGSTPLIQTTMTEYLPGVYIFTSQKTIGEYALAKGIYLVYVNASYSGGPFFYQITEFHIDPPNQAAMPLDSLLLVLGLVGIGAFMVGWLVRTRFNLFRFTLRHP